MIQLCYEGYLLRPQNSLLYDICWDSNTSYISLCHEPGRQNNKWIFGRFCNMSTVHTNLMELKEVHQAAAQKSEKSSLLFCCRTPGHVVTMDAVHSV